MKLSFLKNEPFPSYLPATVKAEPNLGLSNPVPLATTYPTIFELYFLITRKFFLSLSFPLNSTEIPLLLSFSKFLLS